MTRTFLITGAGSGIGAAICRAVAAPGVALLVHTRRNAEGAERSAQFARDAGAQAEVMLGDIADPGLPAALVARAVERFGALDVVVANAGFADKTPVAAIEEVGFARTLDTVLWAFLRMAKAATPHLAASPAGRLIAISSFVAHVNRPNVPGFPTTAAAKAAMEALVRALAVEAAPAGTTVNAVAPGFTRKDAAGHSAFTPEQWKAVTDNIPMGRLGTPDDVAAAVAFLASAGAGYITGQVLHVNGGLV
jgi:3-oxoacyl-[acyl-carrier protein] reductase